MPLKQAIAAAWLPQRLQAFLDKACETASNSQTMAGRMLKYDRGTGAGAGIRSSRLMRHELGSRNSQYLWEPLLAMSVK
ncbi:MULTISPECIES: hypothetical protein [unclassified Rhizobium]|uniref:hypothetical protein n=1 Tax=unclassified Rhizobium TaxID=2613769 RepID=UPI00104BA28F|nr:MULTISPECIES: hypothetical protein [unclassified Rhizobium]MBB3394437.1 hypothetical protein [Rhizobium sp. BK060]MBB4169524.1 hypothetical protein [Rhizobium sp. BK538]